MATLELTPKQKRSKGDPCCTPIARPELDQAAAGRLADLGRAIADPVRVQILDVLRSHAGRVCVCELVPLFDLSQPTISHHLKVLREAGLVASERRGLWAYYYVKDDVMEELSAWLGG